MGFKCICPEISCIQPMILINYPNMRDGARTRRLGFLVLPIPSTFLYMDKRVRLVWF